MHRALQHEYCFPGNSLNMVSKGALQFKFCQSSHWLYVFVSVCARVCLWLLEEMGNKQKRLNAGEQRSGRN